MPRTLVIVRHTFKEAVAQPIYLLLIGLGAAVFAVFALLPFFTFGEDTIMFKAVSLDVVMILVLIATLFATSKSIYEEIEDRTMLTLMSKPVKKWEVLVGKYLGIMLAALLAVAALGAVLILCTWMRIPGDYMIRANSLDDREVRRLLDIRMMHIAGLIPSLLLVWMQIGVLAAVGVALSTRFSLVVNLPAVILLYFLGNLTRFLFPLDTGPLADRSVFVKGAAYLLSLITPYLETFDLRTLTLYRPIALAGTEFTKDPRAVTPGAIWLYVGAAALYAVTYSVFVLGAGMWMFQNRELGGSES